jgi:hypothetical protein
MATKNGKLPLPIETSKHYRFSPRTVEALERIKSVDPDLSENQVVGQLIRNVDYEIRRRLTGDDLAKYKCHRLSRPDFDVASAVYHSRRAAKPAAAVDAAL